MLFAFALVPTGYRTPGVFAQLGMGPGWGDPRKVDVLTIRPHGQGIDPREVKFAQLFAGECGGVLGLDI